MTISIAEALLEATQILRKAGVPEARREAGSLLEHTIKKDRTFLISRAEYQLTSGEFETFRESIRRRSEGEPLQYITEQQDFFGRSFRVSRDVLIPRPETELLVESSLKLMNSAGELVVCDIGTGSGCIAVTLVCERLNVRAVAVDISPAALAVAKQNSIDLGVAARMDFALSDCFDSLPQNSCFDLIVSNPPYVAASAISGLQREVKDHEPMTALSPGPDGLSIIRRLIENAPRFLREDGYLLLEIGFDQGIAVQALIDKAVWELVEIRPDLQGIPRIVVLRKAFG